MRLERVSKEIQTAVFYLTEDQVFQKRFREDEELDYLQSLEHDKEIEKVQLLLALNDTVKINGVELNPITLALYSYLYSIQSNLIFEVDKITTIDLDLFFYLLQTKDYNYDLKQVLIKSMGYCQKVLRLSLKQTVDLFQKIYKIEFKCLNLFPRRGNKSKESLFNVDWMISIVSKVKPLTSYETKQLYKDISLSQIYYYFASYCRMQGDQSIFIRTEDEILFEQDKRMCELVVDRLIEKGVIDQKQRDNILNEITEENK